MNIRKARISSFSAAVAAALIASTTLVVSVLAEAVLGMQSYL
jgi:hypothetical protein